MQQPRSTPTPTPSTQTGRPAVPASQPTPLPLGSDLLRHVSGGGMTPKGGW